MTSAARTGQCGQPWARHPPAVQFIGQAKIDPGIGAVIRLQPAARPAFNISPSLTMLLKAPLLRASY